MAEASAPKLQLPDYLQQKIAEAFCEDLFKACPDLKGLSKKQWRTLQPEIGELYKAWYEHLWSSRDNVPLLRQILHYCLKDRITVTPNRDEKSVAFKGELINGQFIEGTIPIEVRRRRRSVHGRDAVAFACPALRAGQSRSQGRTGTEKSPSTSTMLIKTELAAPPGKELFVALAEVAPLFTGSRDSHVGDEIVYMLEGSITFALDGKPDVTLKAGEACHIPAKQVHFGRTGSDSVKFLSIQVQETGAPGLRRTAE
jgi:quercetin dioxygenase-like cupin family protein